MPALPYGPPHPVSPLIRGIRWGLLICGFFYARGKQKLYNRLEASRREKELERKAHLQKQKEIEKQRLAEEEKRMFDCL